MSGTNTLAYLGPADFTQDLLALLPRGDAWQGQTLAGLMAGFGAAFGDLHAQAALLSEVEMVPETTSELLPDWEADYGLPDCCTPLAPSTAQRRQALLGKISAMGGQSGAYFTEVAAGYGYPITITLFRPMRCGDPVGTPCNGTGFSFVWQVNSALNTASFMQCGGARCGDPLVTYSTAAQLICVLEQIAPAHTILTFSFT